MKDSQLLFIAPAVFVNLGVVHSLFLIVRKAKVERDYLLPKGFLKMLLVGMSLANILALFFERIEAWFVVCSIVLWVLPVMYVFYSDKLIKELFEKTGKEE